MILDLVGGIELGLAVAVLIGGIALGLGGGMRERSLIAAVLVGWLAIVMMLGATEALSAPPEATLDERFVAAGWLGLTLAIPLAALCATTFGIAPVRERLLAMPISILIGLNSLRIVGVLFLMLYSAGRLPAPFAPVAGWGDIIVGFIAIPLAVLAIRKPNANHGLIVAWNIFGLADLVLAVSLGVAASLAAGRGVDSGIMTLLPWILIPCFAVPLLMVTHLAIFFKIWKAPSKANSLAVAT